MPFYMYVEQLKGSVRRKLRWIRNSTISLGPLRWRYFCHTVSLHLVRNIFMFPVCKVKLKGQSSEILIPFFDIYL
jgi:hypothetical protein